MEKTGLEDFYFFSFLKEEELLRLKEISVKKYFNKGDNSVMSVMYEKMNKLVRDNIPNIIEQTGDKPDFVILDSNDYYTELKKKLTEEVNEFNDSDEIIELCDVVEIISAILDYKNIGDEEFEKMRSAKNKANGKFEKRIFLNGVDRMQ